MSTYEGSMKRDREKLVEVEQQMGIMQEVINQMSEIIKSIMNRQGSMNGHSIYKVDLDQETYRFRDNKKSRSPTSNLKVSTSPTTFDQMRVDTSVKIEKPAKKPNKLNTTRNQTSSLLAQTGTIVKKTIVKPKAQHIKNHSEIILAPPVFHDD